MPNRVPRIKVECVSCKKEMFIKESDIIHIKTCSKECSDKYKSNRMKGEGNHFFGKKHSQETIDKIIKYNTGRKQSEEQIEKTREYGKKRFPNGLQSYSQWLEKYGKDEADRREDERKRKLSVASAGSRNPMYGKPSPQGSGNGWSGWYKDWFFRSLIELNYMVEVIEANDLSWESAECKKFAIKYKDFEGKERNYFADFVIGNRIIEIKPQRLIDGSDKVKRKAEAAEKYCQENEMIYEIFSYPPMEHDKIVILYNSGLIKFTDKYEKLFKEKYYNADKQK